MLKKYAQNMSFDEFEKSITPEMLNELSKMNISYNRAYSIFKDILKESELSEDDDMGTMDTIVKNIILDYTDELLAGEFGKYDSDWEA
ncbi:hypothetical protein J2Z76_000023 [Sedimentibacter acidaminivorans]|jgi:hypothetical protein|uniref:Uncharacterized protein n=1 Tax=Sedimentibacter acidaminivorans TaxID=913099 RepID=A0ABS4G907_9FIRM|nr:hypothetical protein [Sedimentibacter acidaminivorans]MBP1924170.1 hypothetical protein [Sedimentibacter acidaminivorans]